MPRDKSKPTHPHPLKKPSESGRRPRVQDRRPEKNEDQPDDLGEQIREQVRQETRLSPYRDRWSGERIHPIQADVSRLVNFLLARRRRVAGALDIARRIYKSVDTDAVRQGVAIVERGQYEPGMHRCCERLIVGCDAIERAFALRDQLKEESTMTIPEQCRSAVIDSIATYDDATKTEILSRVDQLPYDGDFETYKAAIVAVFVAVRGQRVAEAAASAAEAERIADALELMNRRPPSNTVH